MSVDRKGCFSTRLSLTPLHLPGLEWSHMHRRWLVTTCWMKDWKYSHIANILRLDQIPCFNIPVVSHCTENKILAPYERATSSSISGPLFPSNFTSNITFLPYWQHSRLLFTHQASFCLRTFAHPFPRSSQGHFLLQHPSLASSAHGSLSCPRSLKATLLLRLQLSPYLFLLSSCHSS